MPTVPQYTREVKPESIKPTYAKADVNADMFGGNVAKAQGNLGEVMGNFGETMLGIAARIEDSNILGVRNYSAELSKELLHDTDKGYLYKFGEDAYGKSQDVIKEYEKKMTDYISKAAFSPRGKRKAMDTYGMLRNEFNETATSHDFKQGVEMAKDRAESAKFDCANEAVQFRNNPEKYNTKIQTAFQAIEFQGEISHWDDAQINLEKKKFVEKVTEDTLNQFLTEDSLKATKFFEENKKYISPSKISSFSAAVKKNEINYKSRRNAELLIGMSTEDAINSINKIPDLDERDATLQQWSHRMNQIDKIQTEKNNQFMNELANKLADALVKGQDANDLKRQLLSSDLPFAAKQKQIDYINDCLELNQEVHLWNETEYIENLKRTDYESFQKLDLSNFYLTKAERQKYLEEQSKPIDYSTEGQLRDMVKSFDTFFWAGKNSLSGKEYKDDLIGLLARIERLQGKAFDIKHIDEGSLAALIEGFDYKADAMPDELKSFGIKDFKNIDETKELYMRAKAVADIQENVARSYVNFKAQNKREPEPAEMYGIVQKEYMRVARQRHQKAQNAVNQKIAITNDLKQIKVKKLGYTPILTRFEEKTIPELERETGVKMKITSTYRADAKYGHEKGMKADVFPVNPTKENIIKSAEYLLASPDVAVVFCSNPIVYERFKGHSKLQYKQAVDYDNRPDVKAKGINHKDHFDITLSSQFGGTKQNIITNK